MNPLMQVRAHPLENLWYIECSHCGPLGVLTEDVDNFCRAHMQLHGAEIVL